MSMLDEAARRAMESMSSMVAAVVGCVPGEAVPRRIVDIITVVDGGIEKGNENGNEKTNAFQSQTMTPIACCDSGAFGAMPS